VAELATGGFILVLGAVFTLVGFAIAPFLCLGVPLVVVGILLVLTQGGTITKPAVPPSSGHPPPPAGGPFLPTVPPPIPPETTTLEGPATDPVRKFCSNCGATLRPRASFCAGCGARVVT
jgi:hypothetical protein